MSGVRGPMTPRWSASAWPGEREKQRGSPLEEWMDPAHLNLIREPTVLSIQLGRYRLTVTRRLK